MPLSSTPYSEEDIALMRRCFSLAKRGSKLVKSNPQVGAVITYEGRIIGEGYHHIYGSDHAERDALANVKKEDRQFLSQAHMYVSLEPCGHHGKTPPCNQAILTNEIPYVTVSIEDPSPKLQGKSITHLSNNGVQVRVGLLANEGQELIRPFICNNIKQRPYVILKWAQSKDRYIGKSGEQVWLSNKGAKVLVHKWRTEIDGILIGTNTAITDNPALTTRLVNGPSPIRVVLDKHQRLPKDLKILTDSNTTIIFTTDDKYQCSVPKKQVIYIQPDQWELRNILKIIYQQGICRLMVEGGATLLSSFIEEDIWDQARIIQTLKNLHSGIKAPIIYGAQYLSKNIINNKVLTINNL